MTQYKTTRRIIPAFTVYGPEDNEITFWGGSEYALPFLRFDPALVIQADDLSGTTLVSTPHEGCRFNEKARAVLSPHLLDLSYAHLILDWPDMGIPRVNKNWWLDLVDDIFKLPDESDVVLSCTGGRGRTGTMLSILYALTNPDFKGDPVETIRSIYIEDAVEHEDQIEYVEVVTGLTVMAEASWFPSTLSSIKVKESAISPEGVKEIIGNIQTATTSMTT